MMDHLITALQDRGMSEKEAKVYLTVLELGSAPASTIARHVEEKRTSVYALLKKMLGDGIVEEIKRKDISYFSVISPDLLLKHVESKVEGFKETVPLLLDLASNKGSKPKIRYFEGTQGIQKLFEDFATSDVDMKAILGTPKYFDEQLLKYVDVYRRARKKKKLMTYRILSQDNVDLGDLKIKDKEYKRETRILGTVPFDINTDINLYGPNKVSFLFFDGRGMPHIVIVESEDMYHSLYSLFEVVWNGAKKI